MRIMLSSYELLAIVLFVLLPFTLLIVAIADLVKKEMPFVEKILWILLIVPFIIIGPILYILFNRGIFNLKTKA